MSEAAFLGLEWVQLAVLAIMPILFILAIYLGVTAGDKD